MSALPPTGRRGALRLLTGGLLTGGPLMGAGLTLPLPAQADNGWHDIDLSGVSPPLQFSMTRASDGKQVTQRNYLGRVSLLYFGYTYCPDVCPLTLSNLAQVLDKLGTQADRVRVLFVTVDPNRDSLAVLKQYMTSFGPQFVGLRGTPDALASLARRYRIEYSVSPASPGHPYEVTHSSAIYVFDTSGAARLLIPSMASQNPDINGVAADLHRLINGGPGKGLLSHAVDFLRGLI